MNELLLEPSRQIPLVHFRWVMLKGSASDLREDEGLTNYAMELFRRGNPGRGRDEVNHYLAQTCSTVSANISEEMTTVSSLLPASQLEEFSKRVTDVMATCNPSEEEVEKLKTEIIEEQSVNLENPANQCAYLHRRALYEGDTFGNFILGRPDLLKGFDKQRAAKKRQSILENKGYLLIAGDTDESRVDSIRSHFDQFVSSPEEFQRPDSYPLIEGKRLALCHDPHQDQATVIVGWLGPKWSHDDYVKAQLIEKMLTREYSSALCQDFRQRAGLTYGIYGVHRHTMRGVNFTCRYQTNTKFGPTFLEDLLNTFQAFGRGEGTYHIRTQDGEKIQSEVALGGEALEQCRQKIVNSMPFLSYTTQARLARRLEEKFYGSPARDENWMKSRYLEINEQELREMSRQLFGISGFVVTIIDNMEKNGDRYRHLCDWTDIKELKNKKSLLCGQI